MNWVTIFLIVLICFTTLEGVYRGFLHSIMNLGAFFLSIITSFLLYPVVSTAVKSNNKIFDFLLYYTEGAEKIATFKDTNILIDNLSANRLQGIITASKVNEPFATLIEQNVTAKVFADQGLTKIGDYYNMTIVCAVLNILSFLSVLIIAYIVFTFVLGVVNYTIKFPELKQYDRSSGAVFGAIRGLLVCFMIVTIVPVIFLLVPVDQISEYFSNSSFAALFYENNIFLNLIRGTV